MDLGCYLIPSLSKVEAVVVGRLGLATATGCQQDHPCAARVNMRKSTYFRLKPLNTHVYLSGPGCGGGSPHQVAVARPSRQTAPPSNLIGHWRGCRVIG